MSCKKTLNTYKTAGLKALLIILLGFTSNLRAIEPFLIKEIQVQGLQRVELGTFFTYLPIKVGEVLDDVRAPMVIRGIFNSGSFSNVELASQDNILVIVLKERPVISSLTFDGNSAIKTEDLEKGLKSQGLSKGEVLDPGVLDSLKQDLEKQYFSFGKYGVKVSYTVNNLPRNRVNIRFLIEEGEAATIAAITLVGNEIFTDEEISEQFELTTGGWFSWFTDDNQYAREKLGGDIETLRSFYQDRGYLKFSITSTQVAITPDKKSVYITVNIDEGEKYVVSKLSFSGKPIIDPLVLKFLVPVMVNDTYSGAVVTFGEENVAKALGRKGYAFANVSTIPTINEEDHTVELNFFIDPGKRTYIRRISFGGNEKTNDHVLRREMRLMESAALSTNLVDRSKLRLERLPFFEEVNVETVPVVGEDDLVDIVFDVKERPSGSIGGGLGYSDFQGLMINANIVQSNFLGSGKSISLNLSTSKAVNSASINYNDPYLTPDAISFGAGLFFSKSNFKKLGLAGQSLDRKGFSVNYGVPLSEVSRLNFGVLIQDSSLKTAADQGVRVSEQIRSFFESVGQDVQAKPTLNFQLVTASVSWIRNTLNRGVFPDRGTSQTFSVSATVPVGKFDYFKIDYRLDHYIPIARGWSFLMRAQASFGDGYNGNGKLPYFENFFAGGITTLRGFDSNTIGPKEFFITATAATAIPGVDLEDNPITVPLGADFSTVNLVNRVVGGNARFLGGLELIFPTPFASENRSIRSSLFLDVGNVWDTEFKKSNYSFLQPEQLKLIPDFADINNYRASYGVSIQWLSPMGPLIFSLANPFRKQDEDRIEKFSFNIGQTF